MYAFDETAVIEADADAVWTTVSDVSGWPAWDPHVLEAGFDGPFEVGSRGWTISRIVSKRRGPFRLVAVEPGSSYTTRSPMPLGKMLIINRYQPQGDGRLAVSRRVEVYGAFAGVFRRRWADAFRADTQSTFQALEKEAQRRSAATDAER